MERFLPAFGVSDKIEYARLRANADWQRIYTFLRVDYWHVTSVCGWLGIQKTGAIEPNVGSRYPKRFGDITNRSFGFIRGYVSLFDFCDPTEEQVMRQWGNSWDVLVDTLDDQILIQLSKQQLAADIVPNAVNFCPNRGQKEGGCIPWVEVWYPQAIPIACIQEVYRVPATRHFEFNPVPINGNQPYAQVTKSG